MAYTLCPSVPKTGTYILQVASAVTSNNAFVPEEPTAIAMIQGNGGRGSNYRYPDFICIDKNGTKIAVRENATVSKTMSYTYNESTSNLNWSASGDYPEADIFALFGEHTGFDYFLNAQITRTTSPNQRWTINNCEHEPIAIVVGGRGDSGYGWCHCIYKNDDGNFVYRSINPTNPTSGINNPSYAPKSFAYDSDTKILTIEFSASQTQNNKVAFVFY